MYNDVYHTVSGEFQRFEEREKNKTTKKKSESKRRRINVMHANNIIHPASCCLPWSVVSTHSVYISAFLSLFFSNTLRVSVDFIKNDSQYIYTHLCICIIIISTHCIPYPMQFNPMLALFALYRALCMALHPPISESAGEWESAGGKRPSKRASEHNRREGNGNAKSKVDRGDTYVRLL